MSASSVGNNQLHQILDYDWNSYFYTDNVPNSWIELDLKDRAVSLTHYTLKSHGGSANWFRSWVIECSNDRESDNWDKVDDRNTDDLVGPGRIRTYQVQRTGTFYRYVRMRQTGKTSHDTDILALTNIEIFGETKKLI